MPRTGITTKEKEKPAKKVRPQKEKKGKNEKEIPLKKTKSAKAAKAATDAVPKEVKKKVVKNDDIPAESENETSTKKKRGTKIKKNNETEKPEELPGTSKPKEKARRAKRGKKGEIKEVLKEAEEISESAKAPAKKAPKRKVAKIESKEPEPEKKVKTAVRSNATITNWGAINLKCTSKTSTGKPSNFHITSWNVDGIRAWIKKGGLDILKFDEPDIFCLQEIKCNKAKLPKEIMHLKGYEAFWCSSEKEGYAGVGVLSKIKPLNVVYGIKSKEHDDEGRCITAEYENFYLVNVYVPNAGRKLVTLPKRLEWNKLFKDFIKKLNKKKPVIICGDMNVAHKEIDLANPKTNKKNAGFTVEEREGMTDFLSNGYIDTFRQLYPEKERAYTFWTYMANARAKNVGWRLDYFIVSEKFMKNVCDNVILHDVFGSDHCPITLHVNI